MLINVGIGVTIAMLHAPKVRAYMLIIVGIGVTIAMLQAPKSQALHANKCRYRCNHSNVTCT